MGVHSLLSSPVFRITAAAVVLIYAGLFLICGGDRVPENPVLDIAAPRGAIAPAEEALTFATVRGDNDDAIPLLVVGLSEADIIGVDLRPFLDRPITDAFDAIGLLGRERLTVMARTMADQAEAYPLARALPAGRGVEHIAFGTNFVEHGEEVANESVFAFPKFAEPTPAVGTLATDPSRVLLDYEAELCMRFDRDIFSLEDFDEAEKAVFLCGDFTDRATLMRSLPADEQYLSGVGFSDAKSGAGLLPTGPFVVSPTDWRAFVASEVISTVRNGDVMQYGNGGEMIKDFRQMTRFVLNAGVERRWRYEGRAIPLTPGGVIRRGTILLSGTPGGILFRPPTTKDIACGGAAYVCLAGFASSPSPRDYVIERSIERDFDSARFLRGGDAVEHKSSRLGRIAVSISE